jgi:hypothetical protein
MNTTHKRNLLATALICALAMGGLASQALIDEGGVSFWLPGQFGSLAAVPGEPGWSLPMVYYHASAKASGERTLKSVARLTPA